MRPAKSEVGRQDHQSAIKQEIDVICGWPFFLLFCFVKKEEQTDSCILNYLGEGFLYIYLFCSWMISVIVHEQPPADYEASDRIGEGPRLGLFFFF